MNFKEYQEKAARTYPIYKSFEEKLLDGVLGIGGESGEVLDVLKKALFQGHHLNHEKLIEEVGDVLWYMSLICSSLGYTLEDVAKKNIDKLIERYPNGFSTEASINRKEYKK